MNMLPHFLACATCMPDRDSNIAMAGSSALIFMVCVLLILLGTFIKIIFNFARKQRQSLESNS